MYTRRDFLQHALVGDGAAAAGCGQGRRPGDDNDPGEGGEAMKEHLNVGAVIFPEMDQIDFTGPFEVLSRLPDSTFHVLWKEKKPVRDHKGLILTPEMTLAERPSSTCSSCPGAAASRP